MGAAVVVVDEDVVAGAVVVVVARVVVDDEGVLVGTVEVGAVVVGAVVVDDGTVTLGSTGGGPPWGRGGAPPFNTMTWVPTATSRSKPADSRIGIRTQPCDAGCAGTDGDPCTAKPSWKYTGSYSSPRGETRKPPILRSAVNLPVGVTANAQPPPLSLGTQ